MDLGLQKPSGVVPILVWMAMIWSGLMAGKGSGWNQWEGSSSGLPGGLLGGGGRSRSRWRESRWRGQRGGAG